MVRNEDGQKKLPSASADNAEDSDGLCGVRLPKEAGVALRDLVGADSLRTHGQGLKGTVDALVEGTGPEGVDFCVARPADSISAPGSRFTFTTEDELPKDPDPRYSQYDMGAATLSRSRKAVIYFECESKKLDISDPPQAVLLRGMIRNNIEIVERGDQGKSEARLDNLRVLHSVVLSVVKMLGCEDDASLPGKFEVPSVSEEYAG